jgi:hypothetical protein
MRLHWHEITVIVQKGMAMLYAKRTNDDVSGLANGYTDSAQPSIIGRRYGRKIRINHTNEWKLP